jgi:hypothetical protein
MGKIFLVTESEKKHIVGLYNSKGLLIEQNINFDDYTLPSIESPSDYLGNKGTFAQNYTPKIYNAGIEKEKKEIQDRDTRYPSNNDEGNKFRTWFNKVFPYKSTNPCGDGERLDTTGDYQSKWIKCAADYNGYGERAFSMFLRLKGKIEVSHSSYSDIEKQLNLNLQSMSDYKLLDEIIDVFFPGTPIKDGRDLLQKFNDIIFKRIKYNTYHKLPLDTLTDEEKKFREQLLKSTPNFYYPQITELSKLIKDINTGKNLRPEEIQNYKNETGASENETSKMLDKRDELKRMWLGIDDHDGDNTGFWIKSEFKPKGSTDNNKIYYKPNDIPKLTSEEFNELYDAILKTRNPNGSFPGGNSQIIIDRIGYSNYTNKLEKKVDELVSDKPLKHVTLDLIKKIVGDEKATTYSLLGNFQFKSEQENGKKYISIYDKWDMAPPAAEKFGVDIQKYGKTPEIYYRIYE